jgi:hypothetical protein
MITTCFSLLKRPSSGDYHAIQNIKNNNTPDDHKNDIITLVKTVLNQNYLQNNGICT